MVWTLQEIEKIMETINQNLKSEIRQKSDMTEGGEKLQKQVHWRIQDSIMNQVNNKNELEVIMDSACRKYMVDWPKQSGRC